MAPSYRETQLRPGDRQNVREADMDAYWVPNEKRNLQSKLAKGLRLDPAVLRFLDEYVEGYTMQTLTVPSFEDPPPAKITPRSPRPQKVPKVKEPIEEKNGKKTTSPPPAGALSALANVLTMVSGRIGGVVAKGKAMQAKRRANKVAPIESKVQARHLELEPLCCLSSCLVRGGCAAVVAFEAFYVLATLLVVLGGMSRGGFTIWEPLPKSWNAWFGHHIFYYCVCAYDAALLCFVIALARGLLTFSKVLVRAHYLFCYVSLVVNVIFLAFSVWTLSSKGPYTWTATNCLLVFCFAMQIPLQLWALTVVKSCQDFFALIHVFVALAES